VFDGHTKSSVCDYLVDNLHKNLLPNIHNNDEEHIKQGKLSKAFSIIISAFH